MLDGCVPCPAEDAARYRAAGYWRGELLGDLLRRRAATLGGKEALIGETTRLTYAELDRRADRLAAGLRGLGIAPRDRVVVQLPNIPEFVVVCFALFRLGALPVFALPAHRGNEIKHLCSHSDAVAYFIADTHNGFDYRALARDVRESVHSLRHVIVAGAAEEFTALSGLDADPVTLPGPDPADVAFFLLSGGTTALPKLIPRTHDDYLYQARVSAQACELDTGSRYLTVLPVEFNFPWGCPGIIGTFVAGGTVIMASSPSPDECFALLERERPTFTSIVPSIAHLWLEAVEWTAHDLSSLELLQIGSAKLHTSVAARIEPAFGCRLQQVFGMAEGLLCMTRRDDSPETVLTVQGSPLSPADELRVVDSADREVPTGEVGELLTKGPYTLRGYYRAPEHNAIAFTEDGFYRTGDLVRRTEDGNIVVEGRSKDVIIRGGDKVSAPEVEAHLMAHPGIRQASVVATPDEVLGERTHAYLIAANTAPTLAEITRFLLARGLAEFKLPDRIEVVDSFPLTGLGKIDKKALAARLTAKAGSH
ncbi:(2,3-dihydroxybenzoyl)adenylate synthase [Amycolatopsis sp. NPDC058986]|uniref:(2,3-dihydroxybenzoyl)adenylate synthase n=1 Tax=unclassified Amycolatopsis TaxID=2618356 RepID=UPI003670FDA5